MEQTYRETQLKKKTKPNTVHPMNGDILNVTQTVLEPSIT